MYLSITQTAVLVK